MMLKYHHWAFAFEIRMPFSLGSPLSHFLRQERGNGELTAYLMFKDFRGRKRMSTPRFSSTLSKTACQSRKVDGNLNMVYPSAFTVTMLPNKHLSALHQIVNSFTQIFR